MARIRRLPRRRRQDRERDDRDGQQHQVQACLFRRSEPPRQVRVDVSGEKRRLEEEEARAPHRRRSAEPRQQEPRRHRLDEEEEKGANRDRQLKGGGLGGPHGPAIVLDLPRAATDCAAWISLRLKPLNISSSETSASNGTASSERSLNFLRAQKPSARPQKIAVARSTPRAPAKRSRSISRRVVV